MGLDLRTHAVSETVTPAAENYAKSLEIYDSLLLTKRIVREIMPSIKALDVDLARDPEEDGYSTIRLTITTPEPVDRVLELNAALQGALFERLPAKPRIYLSFAYRFA